MTHTVEGWAVQYRANARGCLWKWWTQGNKSQVFSMEGLALVEAGHIEENYGYATRIVRVRQTTEVIEG
jgi:hypothetical protein